MVDNVILPGTGAIIAADDISSALYQKIKVGWGADGSWQETDTAAGKAFPVWGQAGTNMMGYVGGAHYESCPVNATTTLGSSGATGDYLAGVLISPTTTSPLSVSIKDGANTAIVIFAGGASSVSNLVPFFVPVGAKSTAGAWQIVIPASANLTCIGFGNFT